MGSCSHQHFSCSAQARHHLPLTLAAAAVLLVAAEEVEEDGEEGGRPEDDEQEEEPVEISLSQVGAGQRASVPASRPLLGRRSRQAAR